MDNPNIQNSQNNNSDVKPSDNSKKSFPFPDLSHEEKPTPQEPQIGVNLDEEKKPATIEVADINPIVSPSKSTPDITPAPAPTPPEPEPQPQPSTPPAQVNNCQNQPMQPAKNNAPIIYGLVGLLFITLGFGGGYFGFKYFPKIFTTSADTTNSSGTSSDNITAPQNNNAQPSEISSWPSYTNTKYQYTIKYPDTWYAKNVNDPTAANVIFANYDLAKTTSSGYKVDITLQPSNGKTLQDWVKASATTSGNSSNASVPLKIGTIDAIQQTTASDSISTYLLDLDQVIEIKYTAAESFSSGQTIYDQILNSITL